MEEKSTEKKETVQKPNLKSVNLLHLFMGSTKPRALRKLKIIFATQMHDAIEDEKKWCSLLKQEPKMKGPNVWAIEELLEGCKNVWDVEALAQFVFDENEIPTKEALTEKSRRMQAMWPAQALLQ